MKQQLIFVFILLVLPFCSPAQLSKLMSKYHEKQGVTVTQLDKSLYGLYQRDNLPPEASEMLQKLEEVNLLGIDLGICKPETADKAITQLREQLDNTEKYKLTKSRNDDLGKQLIYTHSQNGKVSDLVVWNQYPERLDVIELRGEIQPEKIALLSRALNIKGLNSLASLSSNPEPYEAYRRNNDFNEEDIFSQMRKMKELMHQHFDMGNLMNEFLGMSSDSSRLEVPEGFSNLFDMLGEREDFFGFNGSNFPDLGEFLKNGSTTQQKMEKFYQSFGDGANVSSNSVQITEENGKTKIKIDSKNADMTYVIDGKKAPKNNVQMPESILNVNIIPSREDIKKSYLFITSKDKLGEFISLKDGILTFRYDKQEYRYNLDKMQEPLLVIDGRLSSQLEIDPADILQIRPVSPIEKEVGYYPNAEVVINTK